MRNVLKHKEILSMVLLTMAAVFLLFTSASAGDLPGKGVKVRPVDQGALEELFQFEVLMTGLEELGYDVQPIIHMAEGVITAHVALGQGDADFYATHWDPLHKAFYEKAGADRVEKVGMLTPGSMQGYLIDKKTADKYNIKSIDQLKDPAIAKLFDYNGDGKADLAGCVPGWGCERVIEHHLDAYDLRKTVHHNQGNYAPIIADTIARYKTGGSILYYTWTPMWVSGILVPGKDVEWLTVPFTALPGERTEVDTTLPDGRNLGFAVNTVRVIANKKFLDDNPAAKRFFELAEIPIEDVNAYLMRVKDGEDTEEKVKRIVKEWISKHRAEFDNWIEQAKKATK